MLLKILDTTHIVLINIHASLINANNRPIININAFLINGRNNNNNYKRNRQDFTLAMRWQEIIGKIASLFSINNIFKYIKSTYFWLSYSIIITFIFVETINNNTPMICIFMICIFISIFSISLSKKLVYVFHSSNSNICQHLNYLNHWQQYLHHPHLH